MNPPEPNGPTGSSPDRSPSPPRQRRSPHGKRDDLGDSSLGVLSPLPKTQSFPTLARRGTALLLDLLITLPIPLAAALLTSLVSGTSLYKFDTAVRYATLCLVMYGFYFAWWESRPVRATPGKILLDLRVATRSDKPLTFAAAMIRFWLKVATVLTLNGGLWLAWRDPRGRALHDRLCGSVVIAQHVLPGQLRTAARPRQRQDLAVAVAASLLAYGVVLQAAPIILHQLALADRFDSAIAMVQPALIAGDLVDPEGRWSRRLRDASESVGELKLAIDVDFRDRVVTLRLPRPPTTADERGAAEMPSVRLERGSMATGDDAWSCVRRGLAAYAAPRRCTDTMLSSAETGTR